MWIMVLDWMDGCSLVKLLGDPQASRMRRELRVELCRKSWLYSTFLVMTV